MKREPKARGMLLLSPVIKPSILSLISKNSAVLGPAVLKHQP